MKSYNNLWDTFVSKENFEIAYKKSIRRKSRQAQVIEFKKNRDENLENVRQMVINGNFHTSKYIEKIIYEPKKRTIYKLPYSPDRIVQHAIMNVLEPIFTNLMIQNTYSCINDRGPIKASIKCSEYVRKYKYCLKCDIRKFYPSINQKILSDKLHRIIKDKRFMTVVDDVIFSFEGGYNLPIGNYMSQWCGNYFLSFLDNYVLHVLKPEGYERYCDDFLLFSNDKKFLNRCKKEIAAFLKDYELTYSKADVFSTKQGVDYCGYRHFKKYVLIRKSTSKRIKRRFGRINNKIENNKVRIDRCMGQVAGANGVMKHACSYNYRRAIKYHETREALIKIKNEEN